MDVEQIAAGLPKGAAKACQLIPTEWQFAGKATFNSNGAWSLHHAKSGHGRGALCEMELQKDGKWSRHAYRLTPLGLAVRAHLERQA